MNFLLALLVVIVSVPAVAELLSLARFFSRKELVEKLQQEHFPKRARLLYDKKQGYYSIYK